MSPEEFAADMFFATISPDQLHGFEKRLCDYHAGKGRKPRPRGRRPNSALRPLALPYRDVKSQLEVAARVLEGKAS